MNTIQLALSFEIGQQISFETLCQYLSLRKQEPPYFRIKGEISNTYHEEIVQQNNSLTLKFHS